MRRFLHSRPEERGAAVVEMAFIMPFLILLAMGIIDLGRALYTDITINEAAQEGAIYASFAVRTPAQVEAAIIASVDSPDLAGPETVITYDCPAGSKGQDDFTITVTHEYSLITPIAGLFGGSIELDTEIDGQIFYGECP